ncbi:hypothetical protein DTL21_04825 [Bremerella cremea]|uniref:Uncharacterized protein n=2 Tax=Pirellulales TaxID=2691354 RepID=A0A2S8FZG3_9BACT|nr:hypothetical protein C5Y83_04825 [Blastopirellula marina]RCS49661.1 hypothetical protein DTL21_04825 [Bremerella cremea]
MLGGTIIIDVCQGVASAMRLDCKIVRVLAVALLLQAGCVSVRYDDAHRHMASQPTPAAQPQKVPILAEQLPDLEPPPTEEVEPLATLEPEVTSMAPLPEPTQEEVCDAPSADLMVSNAEICVPHASMLANLRGRLHGLFHWPRREPVVAPKIPPRPKFHPVPTRPVFAQPVVYDEDAPGMLPSRSGQPMPVPPPADIQPGVSDKEAGAPAPLPDDIRIARPLSTNSPMRINVTAEPIVSPTADYHFSIEIGP